MVEGDTKRTVGEETDRLCSVVGLVTRRGRNACTVDIGKSVCIFIESHHAAGVKAAAGATGCVGGHEVMRMREAKRRCLVPCRRGFDRCSVNFASISVADFDWNGALACVEPRSAYQTYRSHIKIQHLYVWHTKLLNNCLLLKRRYWDIYNKSAMFQIERDRLSQSRKWRSG